MSEAMQEPGAAPRVLQALHAIAVAAGGVHDPAELARVVGERSLGLIGGDVFALSLWDADAGVLRLVATNDPTAPPTPITFLPGQGATGRAFQQRSPVVVEDYTVWKRRVPGLTAQPFRGTVAVPLLVAGQAIGVLALGSHEPRRWGAEQVRVLELLAALVAPPLEAARLYAASQAALARQVALLRAARSLALASHPEEILDRLLEQALALIGVERGVVYRWDEERGALLLARARPAAPEIPLALAGDEGVTGRAFSQAEPVVVHEYQRATGALPAVVEAGVQAVAAVPLTHLGRALGVLTVVTRQPEKRFCARDVEALELLGSLAAAVLAGIEGARLEGVALAARTLAHRLNNDLALAVGGVELLRAEPLLGGQQREFADMAASGLAAATEHIRQFQRVSRLETEDTPVGPILNLERASRPPPDRQA